MALTQRLLLTVGVMTWVAMVIACGGAGKTGSAVEKKWYEGGTLHGATMKEWREGSEANKLATAADMMLAALKAEGVDITKIDLDNTLRPAAEGFMKNIDAANPDGLIDHQRVSAVAATLWVMVKVDAKRILSSTSQPEQADEDPAEEQRKAKVAERKAEEVRRAKEEEERRAAERRKVLAEREAAQREDEKKAQLNIEYVKRLLLRNEVGKAKKRLEEIIADYPGTKGAAEAKRMLDKWDD